MSLAHDVWAHAAPHAELISVIDSLEAAPVNLADQAAVIAKVQKQLREQEENVARLSEKTRQKRRTPSTHSIRKPVCRVAHQLLGKADVYQAKKETENGAYEQLVQDERTQRDKLEATQHSFNEANCKLDGLQAEADRLIALKNKQEALYDSIFTAHDIAFPEESDLRRKVLESRQAVESVRSVLAGESEVLDALARAELALRECEENLKDGLYWSTALFLVDGKQGCSKQASDHEKTVQQANRSAKDFQRLYESARLASTDVPHILWPSICYCPLVRADCGPELHEKARHMLDEVTATCAEVKKIRKSCAARLHSHEDEMAQVEKAHRQDRSELVAVRRKIFLHLLQLPREPLPQASDEDAPPPYVETNTSTAHSRCQRKNKAAKLPKTPKYSDMVDSPRPSPTRRLPQPMSAGGSTTSSDDIFVPSQVPRVRTPRPLPRPPGAPP